MTLASDPHANPHALSQAAPAVSPSAALDLMARHTPAPRRLVGSFVFHAPIEIVFDRMTDPNQIAGWMGMITGGALDHSASETPGEWGKGSKRLCHTDSMGVLDETIAEYRAPHFIVYKIRNDKMPIKDHAAYMRLVSAGPNRTEVEWAQYYNPNGVMGLIFPMVMKGKMTQGMAALRKEIGGEKGRMVAI
ncbi:MAG: SRPBCC family protein [Pseudomonadota bacterium]